MRVPVGLGRKVVRPTVQLRVPVIRPAAALGPQELGCGVDALHCSCVLQVGAGELVVTDPCRVHVAMRLRPEHRLVVDGVETNAARAGAPKQRAQVIHPLVLVHRRAAGIGIEHEWGVLAG